MLDDDAGRRVESLHAFPGRIGVGDVVVRELLALQLHIIGERARRGRDVAIERGALMRVLAVAHALHLREGEVQRLRVIVALGHRRGFGRAVDRAQVVRDRAVVLRGMREHFLGQVELGRVRDRARLGFFEHARVIGRIDDHRDIAMVLGRRAQHGRAADVDVLDCVLKRAIGLGDRLLERIQVHDQQIDGADVVRLERGHVFGQIAAREDAAMDLRMQGLDAAIEHFGKAGVIGHLGHGHALFGEQFGGAARGQNAHAERREVARKIDDARLVGNRNQCLLDHCVLLCGMDWRCVRAGRAAAAFCAACCD